MTNEGLPPIARNYENVERKTHPYPAFKIKSGDTLDLWVSPIALDGDKLNLSVRNAAGDTVFALFGLTKEMLASLFTELVVVLGQAPQATYTHLEQVKKHLEEVLCERQRREFEADRQQEPYWGGEMPGEKASPFDAAPFPTPDTESASAAATATTDTAPQDEIPGPASDAKRRKPRPKKG